VDRRKFMNYVILNKWRTNFFDQLKEKDAHFLVGNHDVPYRNTNTPNAIEELLKDRYDYKIYTGPQEVMFDDLLVGVVPWINSGNYQECLDFIKNTKATVLFGHFEISGFEMDKGNVCHSGLDRSLFERFERVISGHFHTKSDDGTIKYLGSQYEMTWADYGDPKGFHVFDTDTLDITFVRNPHIMFHKLWYDDTTQDLAHWKNLDLSYIKDAYVKVIVTTKNNPFLFDRAIEILYKQNPVDIMIAEDYGAIYDESEDAINEAEDTLTVIAKYLDGINLEDQTVDKDRLKKIARELYNEAQGMETE
jgi:DNA repair exonuclease SbcCD nuclease subunit